MSYLSPITYLFGVFYILIGVVVVRRAYKPSCRICLHRRGCPSRKSHFLNRGGVPCYEREPENDRCAAEAGIRDMTADR
jgi:hypothetical protein